MNWKGQRKTTGGGDGDGDFIRFLFFWSPQGVREERAGKEREGLSFILLNHNQVEDPLTSPAKLP